VTQDPFQRVLEILVLAGLQVLVQIDEGRE